MLGSNGKFLQDPEKSKIPKIMALLGENLIDHHLHIIHIFWIPNPIVETSERKKNFAEMGDTMHKLLNCPQKIKEN